MEFYFPPKEKSPALLKAEEKLMEKGYAYSKDKKMCQYLQDKQCLNENQGFIFEVKKGDKAYNQKSYEEIGEILTDYVYGLMESDPMNLKRVEIPNNEGPKSFVFKSDDFETNPNLCILIHGSGVVRAGQWARRLIMNESLDLGTIMPDIMMAKERGFAVLVMNTNDNTRIVEDEDDSDEEISIEGCEDAVKSAVTTWKNFISQSNHSKICIIGHSAGGMVTLKLAEQFKPDFQDRVFGVLLTDSAHFGRREKLEFLTDKCINYVSSDKNVGADLGEDRCGIPMKSAGHPVHEWTPSSSRIKLFEAFDNFYKKTE